MVRSLGIVPSEPGLKVLLKLVRVSHGSVEMIVHKFILEDAVEPLDVGVHLGSSGRIDSRKVLACRLLAVGTSLTQAFLVFSSRAVKKTSFFPNQYTVIPSSCRYPKRTVSGFGVLRMV